MVQPIYSLQGSLWVPAIAVELVRQHIVPREFVNPRWGYPLCGFSINDGTYSLSAVKNRVSAISIPQTELELSVSESLYLRSEKVIPHPDNSRITITFNGGLARLERFNSLATLMQQDSVLATHFSGYQPNQEYPADELADVTIRFFKQNFDKEGFLLDESLPSLYKRKRDENPDNLRVCEWKGKKIPYVLIDSSEIKGAAGRSYGHFYFVAHDLAPEDWQRHIVAVHESLCISDGHAAARREEPAVARMLGKEREYKRWRRHIDKTYKPLA